MSTPNRVRFVTLGLESYAGITKETPAVISPSMTPEGLQQLDPEQGLVIFFPEGMNYVQAEGDQGVGKSSLLNAIAEIAGNEPPPNAVNSTTKNKSVKTEFWGKDGYYYQLSLTKTEVKLYQVVTDAEGNPVIKGGKMQKAEMRTPKRMLKELLGPVGVSPLFLQALEPEKQVAWLRSMYTFDDKVKNFEAKIETERKELFAKRTEKNNEQKLYKASLSTNDYFTNQHGWDQYFLDNADTYTDIEEEIKTVQASYEEYTGRQRTLQEKKKQVDDLTQINSLANDEISNIELQIKKLQESITTKKAEIKNNEAIIKKTKQVIDSDAKWLADNERVVDSYNNINEKSRKSTEFAVKKQAYKAMLDMRLKMDRAGAESAVLTEQINDKIAQKQGIVKSFTPDIQGFEVFIPDEEHFKHGLYYHGKPLNHLAESELWEMYAQLCKAFNIRIIIVENISSLGSGTIAKFNEFLREGGCYIFGSVMKRGEDKMGVIFQFLIP